MIEATSPAQLIATTDGGLPPLERVTDDTWALALPLPASGSTTVPYTLCYLLLDAHGDVHLVDPGFGSDENADLVRAALAALGTPRVASVLVTHLHPDHLGLAGRLRAEHGATVVMHAREQAALDAVLAEKDDATAVADRWGVPAGEMPDVPSRLLRGFQQLSPPADSLVDDGDVLAVPGRDIRVVFTPGHTPGSICLRDEAQGLLFTGDHVLPTVYPGLGLGGASERSPIGEYLESLGRLSEFEFDEVLPGHGYRFRGLADRVAQIEEHHLRRSSEVAEVLRTAPDATVWDVASRVRWTAGWGQLQGFLRYSALAQTEMHMRYLAAG